MQLYFPARIALKIYSTGTTEFQMRLTKPDLELALDREVSAEQQKAADNAVGRMRLTGITVPKEQLIQMYIAMRSIEPDTSKLRITPQQLQLWCHLH